ncbi:HlyD family type I secretion periplasmic adaptor subunit [Dyella sp. ASV21]|uniref:HlyD family type I secretion periplasmic adaptor subunit n=1 Tax=Dyella sp. ASV21 TaxID=2795114 RepID=UPI0018EE16E8|nr:HlyD family type I secretion periplasmic adaptor subunit [Dyella sp. ASV21]
MSKLRALGDLRRRYIQAFHVAWTMRHELDPVSRLRHESEFLPAALALRDTPVHPAPRIASGVIVGLFTMALGWATLSKVDVVTTAPGKIVPNGEVKTIQSQDTAVVIAIHVKDGQRVRQGAPLIDLDATDASTEASRAQSDLYATQAEVARAHALLEAIEHQHPPTLEANPSLGSKAEQLAEQHVLDGEYADYVSNLKKMKADITQSQASLRETEDEISKLSHLLPIEQQKEKDYAELITKGYVGRHDYYNEQQAVIQVQQDLAAQQDKHAEIMAALDAATRKKEAYVDDVRRSWLEKIHDDNQKANELVQDLTKAKQHKRLMHLTAPVDGTVQQLAIHTIGGVVTPAQTLATIVPTGSTLLVEAIVDNQDIGFVKEGMPAEIKVETFPFTRYGTLKGTVTQVSNDAKQDDKLGLIFTAEVALPRDTMQIDDRLIKLTPGMAVTTEIKTGRRRIISYVLSPLVEHLNESLHER